MQTLTGASFEPIHDVIRLKFPTLVPLLNKMNVFVLDANSSNHIISTPYITNGLPTGDRDGKLSFEISPKKCVNIQTIAFLQQMVEKQQLDIKSSPERVRESWEQGLKQFTGEQAYNDAISQHHSADRFAIGIRSACLMALGWGTKMNQFIENCRNGNLEAVEQDLSNLQILCDNKDSFVLKPDTVKLEKFRFTSPDIQNKTTQDLMAELNPLTNSDDTRKRSAFIVNANAGSIGFLHLGGGCFGHPSFGSAQEENMFHTKISFPIQSFVFFELGEYVEAIIEKTETVKNTLCTWTETVDRFMYKDEYAPGNGTVIAIPDLSGIYSLENCDFFLFTAAPDCRKIQMSLDEQTIAFYRIFKCLFGACQKQKLDAILLGALGLGVFKCDVQAMITALDIFYTEYRDQTLTKRITIVKMAYFITKPKPNADPRTIEMFERGVKNFNTLADKYGCDKIFQELSNEVPMEVEK